jgi:hypothetical protein
VVSAGRRIHRRPGRVPGERPALDSADTSAGGAPIDLNRLFGDNLTLLVGLLALALLLVVILLVVVWRRTRRLGLRLEGLTRGSDERSLEAILEAHLTKVHQVIKELDHVEARTAVLERDLQRTFARVGLVRYNPFEDTGGNQSFALALLDAHGDGFIVSSLHARNQTRIYAKGVKGGQADSGVSDEEAEALRVAMQAPAVAGRAR